MENKLTDAQLQYLREYKYICSMFIVFLKTLSSLDYTINVYSDPIWFFDGYMTEEEIRERQN